MRAIISAAAAILIGGAIGGATVFGLVSNTLNSSSETPGDVSSTTASYGQSE
ncbi:hypothetical protein BH09ACT11_BH09ACT11_12830 [soil metagenome]